MEPSTDDLNEVAVDVKGDPVDDHDDSQESHTATLTQPAATLPNDKRTPEVAEPTQSENGILLEDTQLPSSHPAQSDAQDGILDGNLGASSSRQNSRNIQQLQQPDLLQRAQTDSEMYRKKQPTPVPAESDDSESDDECTTLQHGKLSIARDGRIAKYVWVPKGLEMTPQAIDTIVNHWQLPYPSLIVRIESGFSHPKCLLSDDDLPRVVPSSLEGQAQIDIPVEGSHGHGNDSTCQVVCESRDQTMLKILLDAVQGHTKDACEGANASGTRSAASNSQAQAAASTAPKCESRADYINAVLNSQLTHIFRTILDVAANSNTWILVRGSPTGIWVLLDEILQDCNPMPTILVIDTPGKERYTNEQTQRGFYEKKLNSKDTKKLKGMQESELRAMKEEVANKVAKTISKTKFMYRHLKKNKKSLDERVLKPVLVASDKPKKEGKKEEKKETRPGQEPDGTESREPNDTPGKRKKQYAQKANKAGLVYCEDKDVLYTDFWKESHKQWKQQSAGDMGTEATLWNQFIYRGGTHYLFLGDATSTASEGRPELFGPLGNVFCGGGDSTMKDIVESMTQGQPCLLIDNTGRSTQEAVKLHHSLIHHFFLDPQKRKVPREKTRRFTFMMDHRVQPDINSDGDKEYILSWLKETAIPKFLHSPDQLNQKCLRNVVDMYNLYSSQAHTMHQTCAVLNPLDPTHNDRYVLMAVSRCFSSSRCVTTDLAGQRANQRAVATAWQLHAQLNKSCTWHKWASDKCNLALIVLSLLSLFVSLLLVLGRDDMVLWFKVAYVVDNGISKQLQPCVIILPALSGLVSTLSSKKKFGLKWALMRKASCLIEAEIFKFRCRVKDYAVSGVIEPGFPVLNRQGREKRVRDRFSESVRQTFKAYLGDIGDASLDQVIKGDKIVEYAQAASHLSVGKQGGALSRSGQGEAVKAINIAKKFRELNNVLFVPENFAWTRTSGGATHPHASTIARDPNKAAENPDHVDGNIEGTLGFLSATEYHEQRMLTMLHTLTADANSLSRRITIIETSIICLATLGSILGALKEPTLVTVCVVLGTSLSSYMQQHALTNRLSSTNAAVRSLTNLNMEWMAAGPIDQARVENVTQLVEETEQARLTVMTAWTGGVSLGSGAESKPQKQATKADDEKHQ